MYGTNLERIKFCINFSLRLSVSRDTARIKKPEAIRLPSECVRVFLVVLPGWKCASYEGARRKRVVAGVSGYRTEMYCVSCEVRTEFIYVM
jgi:hypothetical protein